MFYIADSDKPGYLSQSPDGDFFDPELLDLAVVGSRNYVTVP